MTDVFKGKEFEAALLKGFPEDLVRFKTGRGRGDWLVIPTARGDPEVKGVTADKAYVSYMLSFRTSPDHTFLDFTAGVGLVSFL